MIPCHMSILRNTLCRVIYFFFPHGAWLHFSALPLALRILYKKKIIIAKNNDDPTPPPLNPLVETQCG